MKGTCSHLKVSTYVCFTQYASFRRIFTHNEMRPILKKFALHLMDQLTHLYVKQHSEKIVDLGNNRCITHKTLSRNPLAAPTRPPCSLNQFYNSTSPVTNCPITLFMLIVYQLYEVFINMFKLRNCNMQGVSHHYQSLLYGPLLKNIKNSTEI